MIRLSLNLEQYTLTQEIDFKKAKISYWRNKNSVSGDSAFSQKLFLAQHILCAFHSNLICMLLIFTKAYTGQLFQLLAIILYNDFVQS